MTSHLPGTPCLHCVIRRGYRSQRGLCGVCYDDRGIRALYPGRLPSNRRPEEEDFCGGYTVPSTSTEALQGTEEKLLVLQARAAAHVSLFHPRDGEVPS